MLIILQERIKSKSLSVTHNFYVRYSLSVSSWSPILPMYHTYIIHGSNPYDVNAKKKRGERNEKESVDATLKKFVVIASLIYNV